MKHSKTPRPAINTAFPPGSETALLSGRFGDWVYFVRNGKQFRRRYVVPANRRTPGQLRTRATFGAAAKYWSHSDQLTDPAREAWETTANQVQSRPRLEQSGPLTGQQYFVACACKGKCGMRNAECGLRNEGPGSSAGGAASGSGPGPYAYHTGTAPGQRQTHLRAGPGEGRHHARQPPDAVHRHTPAGGSWSRAAHQHPQAAPGRPGASRVQLRCRYGEAPVWYA